MPGLVDGHAHGNLGGSKMLLMCSLNGLKTVELIREKLKDFIEKHPEMDKIQGIGGDDATFGVEGPKAEMIDDLTEKPVMLIDYGHHSYWLNSAAMKYKNITKDTPDVDDGVIVRDSEGNLQVVSVKVQKFILKIWFIIFLPSNIKKQFWLFKIFLFRKA